MKSTVSSQNDKNEPKLDVPGAGIPFYQRLFLRFFVKPLIANRSTWENSKLDFEKIHTKIYRELQNLSDEQLNHRILVPPMIGLEDSSRFWSVAMSIEHLGIVGRQIFQLIQLMTHGQVPNRKADTATVKPLGKLSAQAAKDDFLKYCSQDFALLNSQIGDPKSPILFSHPWFGKMNAKQWYWLLSTHAVIHLKQIREIKSRL